MKKLIKYEQDNKIGYKDDEGNVVISPLFDDGVSFWEMDCTYATVVRGGLCGIINQNGETIIPFEYEEVYHLFDSLFAARKSIGDDSWAFGVIDADLNVIISFEYKLIRNEGRYIRCFKESSSKKEYSRLINTWDHAYGFYKYDPVYDFVKWFDGSGRCIFEGNGYVENDCLIIVENNKLGVLNIQGNHMLQSVYEEIHCVSSDRFVVRLNNEQDWLFGVVDDKENVIVDFDYKSICPYSPSFFQCYRECKCEKIDSRYYYSEENGEVWFNHNGEFVFEGEGKELSETLLATSLNGKWGVYNQNCEKVVNFMYDEVGIIQDKIIVAKDGKIGILGKKGDVIISPSYTEIECATMEYDARYYNKENVFYTSTFPHRIISRYYNKEYVFDTSNKERRVFRSKIIYEKNDLKHIEVLDDSGFNFEGNFILKSDNYSELFSIKDGLFPEGRFDEIQHIARVIFAVRKGNKWGVLSLWQRFPKEMVVPCEYDQIMYEGGKVFLVCKDGYWGAKSDKNKVDVPLEFKEIKILDENQTLYGVKIEKVGEKDDDGIGYYTIVDAHGKVVKEMDRLCYYYLPESQFVYYNENRILTSHRGKYGFISIYGYVSIPFKYDKIVERKDGLFDVSIDKTWGVISLEGKEVVAVKYKRRIPLEWKNTIVNEAATDKAGVLSEEGTELLPTIFDHIIVTDSLIFFGYRGYFSDRNWYDIIKIDGEGAIIGCSDISGKVLIAANYNCFRICGDYIMAGRDGRFIADDREYDGVYDLYNFNGEMLLGGFNKFEEKDSLLLFHFGGSWKVECGDDQDDYGYSKGFSCTSCFVEGNGRWLITDKKLKSIIRKKDDSVFQIRKGTKCTIKTEKKNEKAIHYWSFPLEVFSIEKPMIINDTYAIIGDKEKKRVLRLSDGKTSAPHEGFRLLDDLYFFSYDNKKKEIPKVTEDYTYIGLSTIDDEIIKTSDEFLAITFPVHGFVFAMKAENKKDEAQLLFINIKAPDCSPVIAMKHKSMKVLTDCFKNGDLELFYDDNNKRLSVRNVEIFDKKFVDLMKLTTEKSSYNNLPYWYSELCGLYYDDNDDNDEDGEGFYDYRDDEYNHIDTLSDSWDAMTDGMYGDMPEGFGGDYDFLGR